MSGPSVYPQGFSEGVEIRGIPILNTYFGNVYWVNSVTGSDQPAGRGTRLRPFATWVYAVSRAIAGDLILIAPGHAESISAIAGLVFSVAGITTYFLGEGNNRGAITFDTVVGADMDTDAANITIINPRFVAGIDALTGPIDVNAARFKLVGATWQDGTTINTTDCLVADANADHMTIDGFWFVDGGAARTQKQSFIQIAAATRPTIRNIKCTGDFGTGIIENGTAWIDALLENLVLDNASASPTVCIFLSATSSGWVRKSSLRVASGATGYTATNDMQFDDVKVTGTDAAYASDPVIGGIADAAASGAVTSADTLMAYVKQLVTELQVVDELHDVPAANNVLNAQINEVIGNKTDTAAAGAVTGTDTAVAYIKQLVNNTFNVSETGVTSAPTANTLADTLHKDGNFTYDNTTDSLEAIRDRVDTLNTADQVDLDAILADTDTISGITLPANPVANSLAAFIASGGTALGAELADSKSIVNALGFDGTSFVAGGLGMYLPRCVEKSDGAVLTGNDNLFTITGGPVRAKIVGFVTAVIGGASNGDLQIVVTTPAGTVNLNAAPVAIDTDAEGTSYHNVGATSVFTPTTAGVVIRDPVTVEETEFILPIGTVHFRSSAAQTGNIKWYMTYTPLSPASVVVAAA